MFSNPAETHQKPARNEMESGSGVHKLKTSFPFPNCDHGWNSA